MKKIYFTVLFLLLGQKAYCTDNPTALFLLDADPATALSSMGGLFSSVSDTDALYRPWELGRASTTGISFSQWPSVVEGARYTFFGAYTPLPRGALNVNYLEYSTPAEDIEELDGTKRSLRLEDDRMISAGYGTGIFERFFIGGSAKYLTSTLADQYSASTVLFDLGIIYHTLNDMHSGGIALENAGPAISYYRESEPAPAQLTAGYTLSAKPAANQKIVAGISAGQQLAGNRTIASAGIEYSPAIKYLSLRTGMRAIDTDLQYDVGIGLHVQSLEVDIGYHGLLSDDQLETLNEPVRFAVSWIFGPRTNVATAQGFYDRGMKNKAAALWNDIRPDEMGYTNAQEHLRQIAH